MDEPLNYDELDKKADEGKLTEEGLQEELAKYRAAIEEEYTESTKTDPDNIVEYTEEFFKEQIPQAAAQIVHMAYTAESEAVRANLLKFIIKEGKGDAETSGDPIRELMKKLQANKTAGVN